MTTWNKQMVEEQGFFFFGFDFWNNYLFCFQLGCSGGLSCSLKESGANFSTIIQIFRDLSKCPWAASNYVSHEMGPG